MDFNIPTLSALSQWTRGLFARAVDGAVVSIWPNTWYVLGKVLALIAQAFYQRISWLYKQMFLSAATSPAVIKRHAYELGLAQIPATASAGTATFPAQAGLPVPKGVQAQRGDGATFTTSAAVTATGATVSLPFTADVAGANGNTDAAETLTLLYPDDNPLLGSSGTVDSGGFGGGTDAETKETLRARSLQKKRNPPNGGSVSDWTRWMEASSGAIAGVWVDSFVNNARQVWIAFARSDRSGGVPTTGDVAAAQAAVMSNSERPVTARPTVVAIAPTAVAVTLTRVIPDTVAVRAAIAVELAALFQSYQPAGPNGAYVAPATPNAAFTLPVDWIDQAIGRAPGLSSFTRVAPTGDLTFSTPGQIPGYQDPTYV
jgi:uncharacterized phage protein gp47/JayE